MKRLNIRNIPFYTNLLLIVGMMARPAVALGQTPINFTAPTGVIQNIPALISFAISILFIVAGLVAFVYLLLGGIKWITSGGDKGQVEAARNQIVQALIGLVVVFAAWGMIVLVEQLFGIPLGFSKPLTPPSAADLHTVPNFGQ